MELGAFSTDVVIEGWLVKSNLGTDQGLDSLVFSIVLVFFATAVHPLELQFNQKDGKESPKSSSGHTYYGQNHRVRHKFFVIS